MAQKKNLTFEHLVPGGKQYARLSPQFKAPKLLNFYGNDYIYLLNDTVYKVFPDKQLWNTSIKTNSFFLNTEYSKRSCCTHQLQKLYFRLFTGQ